MHTGRICPRHPGLQIPHGRVDFLKEVAQAFLFNPIYQDRCLLHCTQRAALIAACRALAICKPASFDSLPQDPRLAPSAGVKLCTYHRWFGRPQNAACPSYWESPMGNAKLHRILSFHMGSLHLPVEEGRHFNLPRASRVCNLCNTGALGDERHMLLECPALADLRLQFSSLLPSCSSVMRRLLWAKDQHEVCRYIVAIGCHCTDVTLPHPDAIPFDQPCWLPG